MSKKCLINVEGGLGKNIMLTSILKELKEKGIKVNKMDLSAKTITIPLDFDKYNGVMFIFARLRYRVIQKYLRDHGVSLVYDKFWNSR